MPNIELHIDELILRGLPYSQRQPIAMALEQELRRLLSERGLPEALAQGGLIPQIELDGRQRTKGVKPQVIGTRLAQQVYSGMSGPNGRNESRPRLETKL